MQVLLFEALKANRCDYVKVLLARNVVLNDLYLDELYLQVCRHNWQLNLFLTLNLFCWFTSNWVHFQTVLCTECGVQSLNCSHIKWDLKVFQNLHLFLNTFVLFFFLFEIWKKYISCIFVDRKYHRQKCFTASYGKCWTIEQIKRQLQIRKKWHHITTNI